MLPKPSKRAPKDGPRAPKELLRSSPNPRTPQDAPRGYRYHPRAPMREKKRPKGSDIERKIRRPLGWACFDPQCLGSFAPLPGPHPPIRAADVLFPLPVDENAITDNGDPSPEDRSDDARPRWPFLPARRGKLVQEEACQASRGTLPPAC